jgi:hypothetical protein
VVFGDAARQSETSLVTADPKRIAGLGRFQSRSSCPCCSRCRSWRVGQTAPPSHKPVPALEVEHGRKSARSSGWDTTSGWVLQACDTRTGSCNAGHCLTNWRQHRVAALGRFRFQLANASSAASPRCKPAQMTREPRVTNQFAGPGLGSALEQSELTMGVECSGKIGQPTCRVRWRLVAVTVAERPNIASWCGGWMLASAQ